MMRALRPAQPLGYYSGHVWRHRLQWSVVRPRILGLRLVHVESIVKSDGEIKLPSNPLRIAFFGSDFFSVESLDKLRELQLQEPRLIEQLDVITRPPKRAGRDRKQIRDTCVADYAVEHSMNVLRAETGQQIDALAANKYNMAIAVSYGVMISQTFLGTLQYGGLNIHPSMLPSLAGAAPIHHALLNRQPFTGVTVQSLHPTEFDKGRILYQTPQIPIDAENQSLDALSSQLALIGACSLVKVLKEGRYIDQSFSLPHNPLYPPSKAPKLVSSDKIVELSKQNVQDILLRFRVMGPQHFFIKCDEMKRKKVKKAGVTRRLILSNLDNASTKYPGIENDPQIASLELGQFAFADSDRSLILRVKNGYLSAQNVLFEGYQASDIPAFRASLRKKGINYRPLQLLTTPPSS
uniref:methionyl-tRNA formyltransferase n=1 Tax=Blastobotrys adeninivorans TaxID=409370 RepID=A0A060T2Q0_BLAAD